MVRDKCAKNGKRLSGAVLIMVVTVMFVLIIMLLATLTVVSTAQNRSYEKFEENQAYYSARSALDVYVSNMLSDETYYASNASGNKLDHSYDDDGDITTPPTTFGAEGVIYSQALAMELDLYRIKAYAATYDDYLALADKSAPNNTDNWVNPSGVFTTEPYKSDYDNPTENYIEYVVDYPQISSGDYHGKFEDNGTEATIKVEVLARKLHGHDDAVTTNTAADALSIESGSRAKDEITIKVTSTVTYCGVQGVASAIYSTLDEPSYFNNAMTSFGGVNGTNNSTIFGGASILADNTWNNEGNIYGGLYADKNIYQNTNENVAISAGDATYVGGNLSFQNAATSFYGFGYDGTTVDQMPILYVKDGLTYSSNVNLGKYEKTPQDPKDALLVIIYDPDGALNPLNTLEITTNTFNINGDLICNGNLHIGANGFNVTGNVIVNGNLVVTGTMTDMAGNYYVNGNIDLSSAPHSDQLYPNLSSRLNCTGTIQYSDTTGTTYSSPGFMTWSFTDFDDCLNVDPTKPGFDSNRLTNKGVEIFLPRVSSTSVVKETSYSRYIPVEDSQYYNFYHMNSSDPKYGQIITAEEWAGTPKEADRKAGKFTEKSFAAPSGALELPSSGTLPVSGESNYKITTGKNFTNLQLVGSGTINIYLTPGVSCQGTIISGDKTKVNFYAPAGTYTWNVANFTQKMYDILYSGDHILRFVDDASKDPLALKSPKIKFYMSAGTTWNATQAGWCLMTGYIYAPQAIVNLSKGKDGTGAIYYYNGQQAFHYNSGSDNNINGNPMIIGAIVAQNITGFDNNAVCAYIKDEDDPDPGLPQLTWKPVEYRAN